MQLRMSELERFLDSMPRNVEDRKQLLECGYGNKLWEEVSIGTIAKRISLSHEFYPIIYPS